MANWSPVLEDVLREIIGSATRANPITTDGIRLRLCEMRVSCRAKELGACLEYLHSAGDIRETHDDRWHKDNGEPKNG